jgi:hypothetical protein
VAGLIGLTSKLLDSSPMTTSYNAIAGQNVERLAALSDGIFAVAMTLLVLDLRVPATEAVRSERDLCRPSCPLSANRHVHDELHDPRHLLDRAADAIELSCPIKPQSGVDSHRVPFCSYDYAVFDEIVG